jgi:hypothetical protein
VVIIRWPVKPSVIHPHRFPDVAAAIVRLFSSAHVSLAAIKVRRRLPVSGRGCLVLVAAVGAIWAYFAKTT